MTGKGAAAAAQAALPSPSAWRKLATVDGLTHASVRPSRFAILALYFEQRACLARLTGLAHVCLANTAYAGWLQAAAYEFSEGASSLGALAEPGTMRVPSEAGLCTPHAIEEVWRFRLMGHGLLHRRQRVSMTDSVSLACPGKVSLNSSPPSAKPCLVTCRPCDGAGPRRLQTGRAVPHVRLLCC